MNVMLLSGCATTPGTHTSSYTSGGKVSGAPVYQSARHPEISRTQANIPAVSRGPFSWPIKGTIASSFGENVDHIKNKGLDILARAGSEVRAARAGKVVFKDDKFKGFGKTVIIDHGDGYQTVYAYNSQVLVNIGDPIAQNDVIAMVGTSGRAKVPCLHFEIRKNGEPQDPSGLLPKERI
ncbi:MAG: M23 family metallopeptidase [Candidatus Omnitrophota bacterium]